MHSEAAQPALTNRRAIYVNSNYATELVGLKEAESTRILRLLFDQLNNPDS